MEQVHRENFKNGCFSRIMALIDLVNLRQHRLEWARAVFQGVSVGLTFQRQQDGRLGHCLPVHGLVLLHASFANVAATIRGKQAVASTYTCTFVS